jgi:hypothetical protein
MKGEELKYGACKKKEIPAKKKNDQDEHEVP